jgi:hydroxyacylglutathione hydrolase
MSIVQARDGIWMIVNEEFRSNTYVCATDVPGECILIDPGLDRSAIEAGLGELGMRPRLIFCTHGHFDHAGSASVFQEMYDTPVYLHRDDVKILKASNFVLMTFKRPERVVMPRLEAITHDSVVPVGGRTLRFHATPGHTPGSCVLEFGDVLFSGDTLFARSVGMSRLPGEDPERLRRSIDDIWTRFPDAMHVLPGHGSSAPFGTIKRENRKLLAFMGNTPTDETP